MCRRKKRKRGTEDAQDAEIKSSPPPTRSTRKSSGAGGKQAVKKKAAADPAQATNAILEAVEGDVEDDARVALMNAKRARGGGR